VVPRALLPLLRCHPSPEVAGRTQSAVALRYSRSQLFLNFAASESDAYFVALKRYRRLDQQ